MRILHAVKTSDGARWAAEQVTELCRQGLEIHVALPDAAGRTAALWRASGARIHVCSLDMPTRDPRQVVEAVRRARELVRSVQPDLVHSHFVGTTLLLRLALGRGSPIPRVFQVPGPLHLEHSLYRRAEILSSGSADYWIGSSQCIVDHYRQAGVDGARVFRSYYGTDFSEFSTVRSGDLNRLLGIPTDAVVVGNVNFMYPPKRYLGQRIGLKAHEDVIDALSLVVRANPRIHGVLVGGAWGGAVAYERRLRRRAAVSGCGRVLLPGFMPGDMVRRIWADFDMAVHVPISENCGGVIEPLVAGVPVIASRIGGLPEVVAHGKTGYLVPARSPRELAATILRVAEDLGGARALAAAGRARVLEMFDVRRTAADVHRVYDAIIASRR